MIVGFDYWQVISHYPDEMGEIADGLDHYGHKVHVISAIGKTRVGTIAADVKDSWPGFSSEDVHEVVFKKSRESPGLKLAKCKELGITMFFDDRKDVCDLLNANGILAFLVPRKGDIKTDTEAERDSPWSKLDMSEDDMYRGDSEVVINNRKNRST